MPHATPLVGCLVNLRQFDRETGRTIGMAAILSNEPSCLRAEIGARYVRPAIRPARQLEPWQVFLSA